MEANQRPWPAAEVELVPIETLLPFAGNARTHTRTQIEKIADLMKRFGFTSPILRGEDGIVIAGHARLAAAALNQAQGDDRFSNLPTMTARGWSDDEKRAYTIADNQVALLAGWDFGMLAQEVSTLTHSGFALGLLGFREGDLRRLTGLWAGLADPDAESAPGGSVVAKAGDFWALGPHRVACSSATSHQCVERLLGGERPTLMIADPPFGVSYDPSWRNAVGVSSSARIGRVPNDDRVDWRDAWALFPGDTAYVWHAGKFAAEVQQSLEAVGFEIRAQIIWRKSHFAIGRGHYHWQHEPCWYAARKGGKSTWTGDRKQSTVWDIEGVKTAKKAGVETADDASVHGTQKPVECMRRPIENNSKAGDIVYDPFLGSGTTVIAAEQSGRICYGLEIAPAYVDVIIRRWQKFTGGTATLMGTQSTFEQIEMERTVGNDGGEGTTTEADSTQSVGR